ncbi:hypothetical protein BGZ52_009600 [Haplosporangium bisporale]|nr:hypothetical protein BGZ52_009600 [Haplosporangium bisporale]
MPNDTQVPTKGLSVSTSSTATAVEVATETEALAIATATATSTDSNSSDDTNSTPSSPCRTKTDDATISSPHTPKEANIKDHDTPLAAWPETPRQFLERLKETVSKAELGNVLSKGSDSFHQAVLRTHMESFDFRRDPIDMALRKFLLDFHFPKEAQQIDRVLEAFAYRYHACNSHLFRSADMDGAAELKIAKFGILTRKIDIENGKKSSVRGWRDLGVILSGSQLLFFTELGWFQNQKASQRGFNPEAPPEVDGFFSTEVGGGSPPMPQALISTLDSIAVVDSSYQKYPHVFRLVCPNGKQYLFRANSEHDMNDWMAKINYASAFKTAGVRLRSYRVAWASDVYWIKDEQGRHQLRRRLPASTETDSAQVNGRADLIRAKMKDIDRLINACAASLAAELRLARGLEVMIPLQAVTRQKIVQSATVVGKRLRHLMLERTKLDCFRTILERDLAVIMAPCDNSDDHICHAQWIGSQSLSDGSGTLRSQQSIDQNGDYFKLSLAMDDRVDPAKEEYVLDSSRTSQSSSRSIKGVPRSRLNIPEFTRAASETALSDQQRLRSHNVKPGSKPLPGFTTIAAEFNRVC